VNDASVETRDRMQWSLRRYLPLVLVLMVVGMLVAVGCRVAHLEGREETRVIRSLHALPGRATRPGRH
jgi:hypothetical protein